MNDRQVNSTTHPIGFLMVLSSDHISGATGLIPGTSLTVTISKDGGGFSAPSGTITERGNGWYSLAGNATDRSTMGEFVIHATGTGCDPTDEKGTIVAYDPFDANLGIAGLKGLTNPTSGVLPTIGAGAGQITLTSGKVSTDTFSILNPMIVGGAFTAPALANAPSGGGGGGGGVLPSNGLDNIVIETGLNARQALTLITSTCIGLLAGAGTGVIQIKGGNAGPVRITATCDNAGNRTAVSLTIPP